MTFLLSKLLWNFFSPGSLLVFALAAGLVWRVRWLCVFVAVCLLVIATLPVGEWALAPLENDFTFAPPAHIDGLIVIGGDEKTEITAVRGQPTAYDSMQRYEKLLDLSRLYPDAELVFSGGSGHPWRQGPVLDSDVARDIMRDIGVPTQRMIFEKLSRNTYENAVFSANLVHPAPTQKWLLVTSAWHMPRAMGCFRQAGWDIYAAPTDYLTDGQYHLRILFDFDGQLRFLTIAAHEYVGLAAYWLMGRTGALWPS